MSPSPLIKCRVLYLGTALPTLTKDGLRGVQQPLSELVLGTLPPPALRACPGEAPLPNCSLRGVDCWCSLWSNGILIEYVDVPPKGAPPKIFHPIAGLHFCAAVRYAGSATTTDTTPDANDAMAGTEDGREDEGPSGPFLPIDAPVFNDRPARFDQPPIFVCVLRRTHGLKVLECHAFVCKSSDAALDLCVRAREAFLENRKLFSSPSPPGPLGLDRDERSGRGQKGPPLPPPRSSLSPPLPTPNSASASSPSSSPSLVSSSSGYYQRKPGIPAEGGACRRRSNDPNQVNLDAAERIERALETELHATRRRTFAATPHQAPNSKFCWDNHPSSSSQSHTPSPSSLLYYSDGIVEDNSPSPQSASNEPHGIPRWLRDGGGCYSFYESSPITFSPVPNGRGRFDELADPSDSHGRYPGTDCREYPGPEGAASLIYRSPGSPYDVYGEGSRGFETYANNPWPFATSINGFTSLRKGIVTRNGGFGGKGTVCLPGIKPQGLPLNRFNDVQAANARYQFKSWGEALNLCGKEYQTYAPPPQPSAGPELIYVPIGNGSLDTGIYGKGSLGKLKKKDKKGKKLVEMANGQPCPIIYVPSSMAASMIALPQAGGHQQLLQPVQIYDGPCYNYSTTARKRLQPSSTLSLFGTGSGRRSELHPQKARTPDKILADPGIRGGGDVTLFPNDADRGVSPAPNARGIYKRNMTLNEKSFAYSIREGISSHYDIYGSMPRLGNDSYKRYGERASRGSGVPNGGCATGGPPPEPKVDYGGEECVNRSAPPKAPPLPPPAIPLPTCANPIKPGVGPSNGRSVKPLTNGHVTTAPNHRTTVNGIDIGGRGPHIDSFGIDKRDLKAKLQNGLRPVNGSVLRSGSKVAQM